MVDIKGIVPADIDVHLVVFPTPIDEWVGGKVHRLDSLAVLPINKGQVFDHSRFRSDIGIDDH